MFWFKSKKIILDCFTTDPFAHEYATILPATKYYPEWWANLPPTVEKEEVREWGFLKGKVVKEAVPTMKGCRGFTDLYKNSFIIPYWGNLEFFVKNKEEKCYHWQSDYDPKFPYSTHHPPLQYSGWVSDDYQHAKLVSPWLFKTNRYVKFALVDPLWNRNELSNYTVLPGVLDFKYQFEININLMIKCESEERSFLLSPGNPVAQLIPLSEETVEVKNHIISPNEVARLSPGGRIHYSGSPGLKKYSRVKSFLQKHEERNKPKCPFGFGK